jgi:prepilin-type N-terminal cleavage/methylation domain-containing protein
MVVLNDRRGFTLLELMAALVVLGIITVTAIMQTQHTRERAMLALFMEQVRLTKIAAQRFEADVGNFPPDVWRGVDPGFVSKYGWQAGSHSATWDQMDLIGWKGPYLKQWPRNPWGGLYDWDNYPSNYTAWGIPGGGVYLTLKPSTWGGTDGMPSAKFEELIEGLGIDKSKDKGVVAVWIGQEPAWNSVPGQN